MCVGDPGTRYCAVCVVIWVLATELRVLVVWVLTTV